MGSCQPILRAIDRLGFNDPGVEYLHRALALDPLNPRAYNFAATGLVLAGLYDEATPLIERVLALDPGNRQATTMRGMAALGHGDVQKAIADCTAPTPGWADRTCLALAYETAHRRTDSDAQVAAMRGAFGSAVSYQLAQIFAQRGETAMALGHLDAAYRVHDPGMASINTDPWLNSLRKDPRFLAMQRKLNSTD